MSETTYPTLCGSIAEHRSTVGATTHNRMYELLGLPFSYVAFSVAPSELAEGIAALRQLGIRGFGVTMPHKVNIIPLLDRVDPAAREIGAVNTVVNDDGVFSGFNKDWEASVTALKERVSLDGCRVAVLGAGGAARAVAYGLKRENSLVAIFNRTVDKAERLRESLDLAASYSLDDLARLKEFDVLVNTTSVGYRDASRSPLSADQIAQGITVMDIVAEPRRTRLLELAAENGCTTIPGTRMRVLQAAAQFEHYTGVRPPLDAMEEAMVGATNAHAGG